MMKGLKFKNKKAAAFGSYGWSGDAPKQITELLKGSGFAVVQEPLRCMWVPDDKAKDLCRQFGRDFAASISD